MGVWGGEGRKQGQEERGRESRQEIESQENDIRTLGPRGGYESTTHLVKSATDVHALVVAALT